MVGERWGVSVGVGVKVEVRLASLVGAIIATTGVVGEVGEVSKGSLVGRMLQAVKPNTSKKGRIFFCMMFSFRSLSYARNFSPHFNAHRII